jgi:hypothetical protein
MARSDKPGRWLLLLPSVTVGGSDGFKSLDQISAEIMRWGGPSFRPNTLSKELSRLKMTTEKKLAKWWKNSVQPVVTK